MKKILIAAAVAVLMSAPAFAAPEPFSVEVGPQGQFRASPPGQPGQQPTWASTAPGQQGQAMMQPASSDEAGPLKAKKKKARKAAKPAQEGQPE